MREILPQRRAAETVSFTRDGHGLIMTLGRDPSGGIKEIFLNGDRQNSTFDLLLSDAAIVLSLALQNGVQLDALAHSVKRDSFGLALSPLGAAIDRAISTVANR